MIHHPENPWNLTPAESASMQAMCETGNTKMAARQRGKAHNTVQAQVWSAMQKMDARNQIMAVLMWDRFSRGKA